MFCYKQWVKCVDVEMKCDEAHNQKLFSGPITNYQLKLSTETVSRMDESRKGFSGQSWL